MLVSEEVRMIAKIRKVIFSDSVKSPAAAHIFLVLCAYAIITSAYTGLFFGTREMILRFILSVLIVAVHTFGERSPLSRDWTAFLAPFLMSSLLVFGAIIFDGDGLLFIYLNCIAMISLTYFTAKGLAAYIITFGVATAVLLFVFGVNLLGQDFTMVYNSISFVAAMGLNALVYSFCVFCIRLLEKEEAANKAKSAFLSTMSHEIRTPMNAILGITEIQLQNDKLDDAGKESFVKIYTSGYLLLGIINDILDLSKIEAGKLELIIGKYEIASLVSDTAQLNMMRIGSKLIEFELEIDENLPTLLNGDELRVKQILNNLLSNAFKYTQEGTVKLEISTELIANTDDEVMLVISVSDTGQGMTEEQVSKLFDEYSRFNMEANRTTEGTGLGMSITRNLINLMNGDIAIKSKPGEGSTFTVRFPQGKIGHEALGTEMAENLHLFRTSSSAQMKRVQIKRDYMPYGSVLIVDDVETNIYVAKGLMTPYGLKIDSADSGFGAIGKIGNHNIYDIVFMDHMMPQMDGIETTHRIRAMGYTQPIVALTANAVTGQAEVFLSNGFDDFISKPIDMRQLNTILNKFIRDKQPPEVLEAARKQDEERHAAAQHDGDKSHDAPVGATVSTTGGAIGSEASDGGATSDGGAASVGGGAQPDIDPEFAAIFARDAKKALATLEDIHERDGYKNEDDLRTYVINVHGMKSALANVKEMELSGVALKLEAAGREENIDAITSQTPAFLASLRAFIEKLLPEDSEEESIDEADEDLELLHNKLLEVKAACEEYDENAADAVLAQLREKQWSHKTKDMLDTISEHLLHSDFDEIVELVGQFTQT